MKNPKCSTLIESDSFPFEFLSVLAEQESWRKEVHRPIYHVHKWWAKRLGSIFRGILIGAVTRQDACLSTEFYKTQDYSDKTVFDPFMGSGVTIGEAHKLGFIAYGRDINPVACESVRVSLGTLDGPKLKSAFNELDSTVGKEIRSIYSTTTPEGRPCEVLYYFWVKTLPCTGCVKQVDLFSSYIFSRNAYPDRKPEVRILCPCCGDVFAGLIGDATATCPKCNHLFDPHSGPANRTTAACPHCKTTFPIAKVTRQLGVPAPSRLYAKLVLIDGREKRYLRTNEADVLAYRNCAETLAALNLPLPDLALVEGYNTDQAINYGYRNWRQFFNERQLLALGLLHKAILAFADSAVRDALLTTFSGVLEFNNMFASFKGEGTGAVRHMFSHHILKPERTPLEANVWGTTKSSGSFSTLFQTRLFRAIDYQKAPTEIAPPSLSGERSKTKLVASLPFTGIVSSKWPPKNVKRRSVHVSCGNSAITSLPDESVDLIVTDPPFFDNVHYSELADFFYAWQQLSPGPYVNGSATTRHPDEVQDVKADAFSKKLKSVFRECSRVLVPDGLLVFSYHHSRQEGWAAVAQSIADAGFSLVNAHPVKAELSVATPKAQSKDPIQLDIIMVCKLKSRDNREVISGLSAVGLSRARAETKIHRLEAAGFTLSAGDRRIIYQSQLLTALFPTRSSPDILEKFQTLVEIQSSESPPVLAALVV